MIVRHCFVGPGLEDLVSKVCALGWRVQELCGWPLSRITTSVTSLQQWALQHLQVSSQLLASPM